MHMKNGTLLFFFFMSRQLMMLHFWWGGGYVSLVLPHSVQMETECIYSLVCVTRQPANGGLP